MNPAENRDKEKVVKPQGSDTTYIDSKMIENFLELVSKSLSLVLTNEVALGIKEICGTFEIGYGVYDFDRYVAPPLSKILQKIRTLDLGVNPTKFIYYSDDTESVYTGNIEDIFKPDPEIDYQAEYDEMMEMGSMNDDEVQPDDYIHEIIFQVDVKKFEKALYNYTGKTNPSSDREKIFLPKSRHPAKDIVHGKLRFNESTGDFQLGKVRGTLSPDTQEYKLILKLLTSESCQAKSVDLLREIYPDQLDKFGKTYDLKLGYLLRNVKKRMGILPKKRAKNIDIFENLKKWKGYRLLP